jgi:hypothetical protein
MDIKKNNNLSRFAITTTWAYFIFLVGWFTIYTLTGDRFGYLGIINSLALFFFLPLPLAAIIATWTRRGTFIICTLLGIIIFLWLWGPLFAPGVDAVHQIEDEYPGLTVMTYRCNGKSSVNWTWS